MKKEQSVFKSTRAKERFYKAYARALELWPVAYEEIDISTRYGPTHIIVSGPASAPPLLLFHCALMTSVIWGPIIEELSRYHRTYCIDVIGDAGKTVPIHPPHTEAELADWVLEIYKHFEWKEAEILAWSFGGFVGANFSIVHPDKVKKLILLAPFMTFQKAGVGFMLGFLPLLIPIRYFSRVFEKALCYKNSFGDKVYSNLLFERFRGVNVKFKVPPRVFSDEELNQLNMPVMLLIGREEFLYNGKKAIDRAHDVLPKSTSILVPHCNHAMVSDQTELVKNNIISFLG